MVTFEYSQNNVQFTNYRSIRHTNNGSYKETTRYHTGQMTSAHISVNIPWTCINMKWNNTYNIFQGQTSVSLRRAKYQITSGLTLQKMVKCYYCSKGRHITFHDPGGLEPSFKHHIDITEIPMSLILDIKACCCILLLLSYKSSMINDMGMVPQILCIMKRYVDMYFILLCVDYIVWEYLSVTCIHGLVYTKNVWILFN